MKIARWVFHPPAQDRSALIAHLVGWSTVARKQGLLGLEAEVQRRSDPFLRKGLQMVVDGVEPEAIRQMLEIEMHGQSSRDLAAAKVFEGMGIYSPTLGIIGAVLGLIAVMSAPTSWLRITPSCHARRAARPGSRPASPPAGRRVLLERPPPARRGPTRRSGTCWCRCRRRAPGRR